MCVLPAHRPNPDTLPADLLRQQLTEALDTGDAAKRDYLELSATAKAQEARLGEVEAELASVRARSEVPPGVV